MSNERIVVLSDKEQARQRINVFHGSATNWINMIKELVGNSLDVFEKDKLNHISIKIIDNKTIEYIDSGKGIPLEGTASDGRPNYEAILNKAFAGSKYQNTAKTVGQNGIFLYSLTMTCSRITYEIARPDGNIYSIEYKEGDRISDLEIIGKSETTYSKITFTLDDKVWRDINFTYDEIARIIQGQAAQANVEIYLEDVQSGKNHTYYYENGLVEYFDELTSNKTFVTDLVEVNKTIMQPVDKDITDEIDVRFIMKYANDSNDDIQKEFLNTADLIQHGTIQDGIAIALRKVVDKWLKTNNKYNKSEKAITKDDVLTGLNYVCCILSYQVEYDNQVKQKTSAVHYRKAMESILEEFFDVFQVENKFEFERICNQVLINKRARDKSESIRQNVKKKLSEKTSMFDKPQGLIECRNKDINERMLLICEGKSALGSLITARRDCHALYALRGKVLNVFKANDKKIIDNDVITDLYRALGCGIELSNKKFGNFDINNIRYSKIGIMTDLDFDGIGSIAPLLLTMFYKLSPELIRKGMIYFIYTPKYEVDLGNDKFEYAITDADLEELKIKLKSENKKYKVNYIKGLAELNPETMAMALSEGYTNIERMTIEDAEKFSETLNLFFGSDIDIRKEYIMKEY